MECEGMNDKCRLVGCWRFVGGLESVLFVVCGVVGSRRLLLTWDCFVDFRGAFCEAQLTSGPIKNQKILVTQALCKLFTLYDSVSVLGNQ